MGFRFRKSVKLGKHTRLNLSKSGVGISTGVKGFRVSAGTKGMRTTASIPGTGISYTQQHSAAKPKHRAKKMSEGEKDLEGVIGLEVYGVGGDHHQLAVVIRHVVAVFGEIRGKG